MKKVFEERLEVQYHAFSVTLLNTPSRSVIKLKLKPLFGTKTHAIVKELNTTTCVNKVCC